MPGPDVQHREPGRPRLLFVVNVAWFFLSHRLALARAASRLGYDVHLAADFDHPRELARLAEEGISFHRIRLQRGGLNPLTDLVLLFSLGRLYRRLAPDIVHHVTVKPVLYGGAVARWLGVPGIVHAVPGLGYVFTDEGSKARLLRRLVGVGYRHVFGTIRARGIFQNCTDLEYFVDRGWIDPCQAVLIPGAGVDVERFRPGAEPSGPVTFVLPARILREKGIVEFAAAASMRRREGSRARFVLAGGLDPGNPGALSRDETTRLCADHGLEWVGHVEDVPALLAASHVVCLPSYYREGLPKALLEACASGRAIVTTDMPGCRDVVRDGENGLLVPVRDVIALAAAMRILEADGSLRQRLGEAGRERALREFSEPLIVQRTMDLYAELGGAR